MTTPDVIERLRAATRGTEYEGRLFLVGGVLRDRALGLPQPDDLDLVLEGDAVALAELLARRGLSDHAPVLFPRFGTAKIAVGGHDVELVTARAESYETYSRKPSVMAASLRDDAFRRDFTINTLMQNLHTGEELDLTGRGLADLAAGVIRTPLDPHVTFYDDPLRMLRAVRFACRFGFRIDSATWSAIQSMADRLSLFTESPPVVSAERIRDEFVKILTAASPMLPDRVDAGPTGAVAGLQMLLASGLLAHFLPELVAMVGVTQNDWHAFEVWTHTLHAMERLPSNATLEVRLALLLHDVGKPRTRTEDAKGVHFYDHQSVGADMARRALNRLRFSSDQVRDVVAMVALHMRLGEAKPGWSDAAVRRLIRAVHPYTDELFTIAECDIAATRPDASHADLHAVRARMALLNRQADVARMGSPLDGLEIMALLGIPGGPDVREAKDHLTNLVVEGRLPEGDKEMAAELLRSWWLNRAGGS